MIDFALELEGDNRLVACLWHQGEEDVARNCTAGDYEKYLSFFIDSIRERYHIPKLPFIAGDFVSDWKKTQPRAEEIKQATINVLKARQNTAYVTSENLLSNREAGVSETDNIHFCRQALREMGRRYYQAYSKIQFYK